MNYSKLFRNFFLCRQNVLYGCMPLGKGPMNMKCIFEALVDNKRSESNTYLLLGFI